MIVQLATEGINASMFYVGQTQSFGISGAINQFGFIGDLLGNIGVDLPPIQFSADLSFAPPPLKYQDTVFEKFNQDVPTAADAGVLSPGGLGLNHGMPGPFPNPHRGIAFQLLGDINNPGGTLGVPHESKYEQTINQIN